MDIQGSHSLIVGSGQASRRIAYRTSAATPPQTTGVFWLSGFMSDMASTKATAVAAWAGERGIGATRFDYSGHGQSDGPFTDGTIGRWLEEARAVFAQVTEGPQVVVGSSMGGHIALVMLRDLLTQNSPEAERIKAIVLIAPAWNMTEDLMWNRFSPDVQRQIAETGAFEQPSNYGSPYIITRQLIEDGRRHLLSRQPFEAGRPITILQGLRDPDVPAAHTRELLAMLSGDSVNLVEIPDGDHRLSRDADLDLLFRAIEANL